MHFKNLFEAAARLPECTTGITSSVLGIITPGETLRDVAVQGQHVRAEAWKREGNIRAADSCLERACWLSGRAPKKNLTRKTYQAEEAIRGFRIGREE